MANPKASKVTFGLTLLSTTVVELDRLGARRDPPISGRALAARLVEEGVERLLQAEKVGTPSKTEDSSI